MTATREENILDYVLGLYFHVNHGLGVEDVTEFLNNPNAPQRNSQFKQELFSAISEHSINPLKFEKLTGDDYETQEEVDEFLKTKIWQPLYGDEPIKG